MRSAGPSSSEIRAALRARPSTPISIGALAGNLFGAMHGVQAILRRWLERLELKNVIGKVAEDLYAFKDWPGGEYAPDRELSLRI